MMAKHIFIWTKLRLKTVLLNTGFTPRFFISLVILLGASAPLLAHPKATLTISPKQCVALHRGQTCHQKVKLHWQAPTASTYCLKVLHHQTDTQKQALPLHSPPSLSKTKAPSKEDHLEVIQCWKGASNGKARHKAESKTNITYYLVDEEAQMIVTHATLKVAWVYSHKQQKQKSWRLF